MQTDSKSCKFCHYRENNNKKKNIYINRGEKEIEHKPFPSTSGLAKLSATFLKVLQVVEHLRDARMIKTIEVTQDQRGIGLSFGFADAGEASGHGWGDGLRLTKENGVN